LRYCYEAQWLDRIPATPKIKVDVPETLPLTEDEYARLLAVVGDMEDAERRAEVRALVDLMRWSGLALRDALTLPVSAIQPSPGGHYRVIATRAKNGNEVMVPVPAHVGDQINALPRKGPYIFWDGSSDIAKTWTKYIFAPMFRAAKITAAGYMVSHRLRDTFAVDLLSKGVPMEEVSRMLGHTSIKTTERYYAKWSKARQDRLDALVTAAWDKSVKPPATHR
jgi:integrase